jgi:putative SOS response-associated peptidase YedK
MKNIRVGARPVPTDGFYEWKVLGGKIPYSISMKDGARFVFAGLWEGWKDPANNEWLHTYSIITGEPNEFAAADHTRMPIILPEEHHDAWLFVKPEKPSNTAKCVATLEAFSRWWRSSQ